VDPTSRLTGNLSKIGKYTHTHTHTHTHDHGIVIGRGTVDS